MDAFFASVEQLDQPCLRDRPVIVEKLKRRERAVASASYEARVYGVSSGMPLPMALALCPQAQVVSPRSQRYRAAFSQVLEVFHSFTPLVEPCGQDEAYLDVTEQLTDAGPGPLAARLRARVRDETGLSVSVGGSASRIVSKVACGAAKPAGILLVAPGKEQEFLYPMDVALLPGVGGHTAGLLRTRGVDTAGDLARCDEAWLLEALGPRGAVLKAWAQGKDTGTIGPHGVRRSISASAACPGAADVVLGLAGMVARALGREALLCSAVRVTLHQADGGTLTRQTALPAPTCQEQAIVSTVLGLLDSAAQAHESVRRASVEALGLVDALAKGQRPAGPLSLGKLGTGSDLPPRGEGMFSPPLGES